MARDPLLRAWRQHLREEPVQKDETAVYLRCWLGVERGELPSPVQGECWLDVKRSYIQLRSRLRRCYISVCDIDTYGPTAQTLGFRQVERASVAIDGVSHHLAVLDFGPGSVDGWLSALVAAKLGEEPASILDFDSRELVLEPSVSGSPGANSEFCAIYAFTKEKQFQEGNCWTKSGVKSLTAAATSWTWSYAPSEKSLEVAPK